MVALSIAIPVYNGEANIIPLIEKIKPVLEKAQISWEIIFVDDGSPDNSFEIIKEAARNEKRIKGFKLTENRGQQNAVFCGVCEAKGQLVITMDDDGQHPVSLIPELINRQQKGFDIVYAVNRSKLRPRILRWGTEINDLFFSLFLGKPFSLEIGSYRIVTKELIDRFRETNNHFIYLSALIFAAKPPPHAASFHYHEDSQKKEKTRINWQKRFRLFVQLFTHYGPFSRFTRKTGNPYEIEESV